MQKHHLAIKQLKTGIAAIIWIVLIAAGFANRERFSLARITAFVSARQNGAVFIMLLLFAFKSMLVFVYGGILYAVSGIVFPIHTALLVNSIGTVIMTTIPFLIGRRKGKAALDNLAARNEKISLLQSLSSSNEFFVSLIVRLIGFLPADLVGMYLGSSGIHYWKYILGTIFGLFPSMICYSIMGTRIDDMSSPEFIISTIVQVVLIFLSIVLYCAFKRKNTNNHV